MYICSIEALGSWIFLFEAIEFENYIDYFLFIQGLLQFLAVSVFIYFSSKRYNLSITIATSIKWFVLAFLLGILFVYFQTPLKSIYNWLFGTAYQIDYLYDGFPKFKNINLIASILLIPVGEELFFRGYIQNKLQREFKPPISIFVTAVLFALIHSPYLNLILEFSNEDWHLFYLTFFGGIISGILFFKSKSIGSSIVFHVFWNTMVTIV